VDPITYDEANAVQRALRRLVASGPGSWLAARVLDHLDRPVHRLTGGRSTLSSLVSGLPLVMVTTTGARSGRPHTVPLLGLPTPDGVAVVASNYGQRQHPAWYFNLRADPTGEVVVDGAARRFHASEAEGTERERIWNDGLAIYPGWAQYERRAAHRRIAVFVLRTADPT
jgi:deazaflavin-dependent oxidoreductase (nitroreductase family)